ncbi:hypothetical protein [Yersinia alsatica]|uniref:hypothetical protein n=1 Tax=Yersinia alsatica TaxID=2890317 RepID=UPI0011AB1E8A|nr:hypothetical protein [Yersinia alsatica]
MDYYEIFKSEEWRTNTFNFGVGDTVKGTTERRYQYSNGYLAPGSTAKIVTIEMGNIGVMGAILEGYGDRWHSLANLDLVEGSEP